jgi:hypothetical protein
LEPARFQTGFLRFMDNFAEAVRGVIAIDGKTLRRSFDRASGKSPLHLVSAWAVGGRLVPGQVATEEKSNEIIAVPKLLAMLSLNGQIVTVDAMSCQRAIAAQVIEQGGDYVLALKGNQGTLRDDVRLYLDDAAHAMTLTLAGRWTLEPRAVQGYRRCREHTAGTFAEWTISAPAIRCSVRTASSWACSAPTATAA